VTDEEGRPLPGAATYINSQADDIAAPAAEATERRRVAALRSEPLPNGRHGPAARDPWLAAVRPWADADSWPVVVAPVVAEVTR